MKSARKKIIYIKFLEKKIKFTAISYKGGKKASSELIIRGGFWFVAFSFGVKSVGGQEVGVQVKAV